MYSNPIVWSIKKRKLTFFFCCFEYFCRGFGFITFREAESVEKVLETHAEDPIWIDQKMVNCSPELEQNCSPFWIVRDLYLLVQ